MLLITLPDGRQRPFNRPVTVADVAASIGKGLARAARAGVVDGKLVDTSQVIERDATLRIVRSRDPEGLEILRDSTACLSQFCFVYSRADRDSFAELTSSFRQQMRERILGARVQPIDGPTLRVVNAQ